MKRMLTGRGVGTKDDHYLAGPAWSNDERPSALGQSCESSFRALGVDTIDLYYLRLPDPAVPLETSWQARVLTLGDEQFSVVESELRTASDERD
jgi:aryl-alcohol dehydrogenase-like predicted oxidoreductase